MRLPAGVSVALVVRHDRSFVPESRTKLRHGDEMLIVAPRRLRDATEKRMRAVSRSGRLAGWFGEAGQRADEQPPPLRRGLRRLRWSGRSR